VVFPLIDIDHDGKVSAAEMEKWHLAVGLNASMQRASHEFASTDADGNGKVSLEEYLGDDHSLVAVLEQARGNMTLAQQLAGADHYSLPWVKTTLRTFQLADADGSNDLDGEEFFQCVTTSAVACRPPALPGYVRLSRGHGGGPQRQISSPGGVHQRQAHRALADGGAGRARLGRRPAAFAGGVRAGAVERAQAVGHHAVVPLRLRAGVCACVCRSYRKASFTLAAPLPSPPLRVRLVPLGARQCSASPPVRGRHFSPQGPGLPTTAGEG
jgi:hypothetical protein